MLSNKHANAVAYAQKIIDQLRHRPDSQVTRVWVADGVEQLLAAFHELHEELKSTKNGSAAKEFTGHSGPVF